MPEITLRHEIETDEDTFWSKIVFDEGFNKLYIDELEFPQWKLLEMKDDDARSRVASLVEHRHQRPPRPDQEGVGGDKLAYTEEGTFDKKSKRYVFKTIASLMPDKTKVSGEMWSREDRRQEDPPHRPDDGRGEDLRSAAWSDRIIKDLQSSYDASTTFTNRYIKEHGL